MNNEPAGSKLSERKAKTCGRRAVERAAAMCTLGGLLTRVLSFILPQHTSFTHDAQRVQPTVHIRRAVDKRGADADIGHHRHSQKHRKTNTERHKHRKVQTQKDTNTESHKHRKTKTQTYKIILIHRNEVEGGGSCEH